MTIHKGIYPPIPAEAHLCQCGDCFQRRRFAMRGAEPLFFDSRMILCAIRGNKRCPHATHHDNACTNSNEPGQPGSSYQ